MTKKEIAEIITRIAYNVTGAELNDGEMLKECGLDSLSLVAVIAETEEKLGFSYSESELNPDDLQTLADLVRITEKHV